MSNPKMSYIQREREVIIQFNSFFSRFLLACDEKADCLLHTQNTELLTHKDLQSGCFIIPLYFDCNNNIDYFIDNNSNNLINRRGRTTR